MTMHRISDAIAPRYRLYLGLAMVMITYVTLAVVLRLAVGAAADEFATGTPERARLDTLGVLAIWIPAVSAVGRVSRLHDRALHQPHVVARVGGHAGRGQR
ncbi:hypothetical protein ACFQX7_31145 [Luedemannella flava]